MEKKISACYFLLCDLREPSVSPCLNFTIQYFRNMYHFRPAPLPVQNTF